MFIVYKKKLYQLKYPVLHGYMLQQCLTFILVLWLWLGSDIRAVSQRNTVGWLMSTNSGLWHVSPAQ